jgi:hypothetical protein
MQAMSLDLNAAIRRMRAIIHVLDEDLATADRLFGTPLQRAELSPDVWKRAEAARQQVELSLTALEGAAADASRRARNWQEKAVLAVGRRDEALARQAIDQAGMAADEAAALTVECKELQIFLTEWAVRVSQAPAATHPEAAPADWNAGSFDGVEDAS